MPCRYFNGSNQSVEHSGGGWPPGDVSNPLTLACWFKVPSLASNYTLISVGRSGSSEYFELYVTTTGTVKAEGRRNSSTISAAESAANVKVSKWCFAAGTVATTTDRKVYLYVDGLWSTVSDTTSVASASSASVITRFGETVGGPGSDLNGYLAYPQTINLALSFEHIRLLAFNPFLFYRNNQIQTYYFEGMNPERDHDGVNNGTINGTPVPIWSDGPPVDYPRKRYVPVRGLREPTFSLGGDWISSYSLGKAPAGGGGGTNIYRMALMGVS